jgi:hypothetical protein
LRRHAPHQNRRPEERAFHAVLPVEAAEAGRLAGRQQARYRLAPGVEHAAGYVHADAAHALPDQDVQRRRVERRLGDLARLRVVSAARAAHLGTKPAKIGVLAGFDERVVAFDACLKRVGR